MSSGNRKTYDPQRLLVNPADKLNLKRDDEYVALSNLTIYYKWKNNKNSDCNWTRTQNHLVLKRTLGQMVECSFKN